MLHSVLIYWTYCQLIWPTKLSPHPSPSPLCSLQNLSSLCFLKYSSFWLLCYKFLLLLWNLTFLYLFIVFLWMFLIFLQGTNHIFWNYFSESFQTHFREGNCSESSWSWCFIFAEKFSITNLTFSKDCLFTDFESLVGLDLA